MNLFCKKWNCWNKGFFFVMFWLVLLVYLAAQNPIAILRKLMDLFEAADWLRNDDGSTLLKYV